MFKKIKGTLLMAAIVACFNPALAVQSVDAEQTDFSGTWVLDADKSDIPEPGSGRSGPGGRGGPGVRGGPGGMGDQGSQGMTLVIFQVGDFLNLSQEGGQGGGFEISLEPGAGTQEVSTARGGMTVEANWDGGNLMVHQIQDMDTPRGTMKIEQDQTWELSADGQTLTQKIKVQTPRGDRNLTLVFDKQ